MTLSSSNIQRLGPFRSMLFVPANVERFLNKASESGADAIILDLEDSVPEDQKSEGRTNIKKFASLLQQQGFIVIVRTNRKLQWISDDFQAAIEAGVDVLMLPKVDSASHLHLLEELATDFEYEYQKEIGSTGFLPLIESANALNQVNEIAKASMRNVALMCGTEDMALSLGVEPSMETLQHPSLQCLIAARSAGILPLGLIGGIAEFQDKDKFRKLAEHSSQFGFEGAACIHPSVISILNEAYSPRKHEVERAKQLISVFEKALEEGRASAIFEGQMIDPPIVERARALLKKIE